MSALTFADQLLKQAKIGIYSGRRKLTPIEISQRSRIARKWIYTLKLPDGSTIETDNLPAECRLRNLTHSTLCRTSTWYTGADPQVAHKRHALLGRKPVNPIK